MHRDGDVDVIQRPRTAIGRRRALQGHSVSPNGVIRSFVESETWRGNRACENNRVPADLRKSDRVETGQGRTLSQNCRICTSRI